MEQGVRDIVDVIESWSIFKEQMFKRPGAQYADGSNPDSMRAFIEGHNIHTRKLMRALERERNEDFWVSLLELAQQGATISAKAKTFVDGVDRSQVGM